MTKSQGSVFFLKTNVKTNIYLLRATPGDDHFPQKNQPFEFIGELNPYDAFNVIL